VNPIVKWIGIVVLLGFALMYVEYRFAKKKKEGFTPIDRQRIMGILGLTIFFAALVGWVIWVSD
jgi:predicted acyltransferase